MKHYILITVDVEDWFQVENFRSYIKRSEWDRLPARVVQNTIKLLDLFEGNNKNIKATFFVLGWVAENYPDLIREISRRGHEVASHGYDHMMCSNIDSDALYSDLIRSKNIIENIIGREVEGYRAPSFSISDSTLSIVMKAGYRYDSSYNSFAQHGRYGSISTRGRLKNGIAIRMASNFYELPISNLEIGGQTIPWGGGGYFRFLPFSIFKKGVQNILSQKRAYMFYMHPWEIDPEQPRVKEAKGVAAFRHYLNLSRTHARLGMLIHNLQECEFTTCSQYLKFHKSIPK